MDFDDEVKIGKFYISNYKLGGIWIGLEDGEGMQVQSDEGLKKLEELLEKYWNENF